MGKVVSKTEILPAVNMKEVELAVERITGSWTKTIHALIETAMMLHEYQMSPGNHPLEAKVSEVEFFPMEEVLHEEIKIQR